VTAVRTAKEALNAIGNRDFHCIILDLGLPDMDGIDLLHQIRGHERGPGSRSSCIPEKTCRRSRKHRSPRVGGNHHQGRHGARTARRRAFALSARGQTKLPAEKRRSAEGAERPHQPLEGKKVLVVDDDVRNILALTSALEAYRLEVLFAKTAKPASTCSNSIPTSTPS